MTNKYCTERDTHNYRNSGVNNNNNNNSRIQSWYTESASLREQS